MTSPGETSAAAAIARTPAVKPCTPKVSIAASRIRARADRSASIERMFNTLNGCSARAQESAAHRAEQAVPEWDDHRGQLIVLGDRARRGAHRHRRGIARGRVGYLP